MSAVYGFCPICGAKGHSRERRPNGNDKCEAGHTYPSKDAVLNDKSIDDGSHKFNTQQLEDLIDRACRGGNISPLKLSGLSELTDWLRGLYPEFYSSLAPDEQK